MHVKERERERERESEGEARIVVDPSYLSSSPIKRIAREMGVSHLSHLPTYLPPLVVWI